MTDENEETEKVETNEENTAESPSNETSASDITDIQKLVDTANETSALEEVIKSEKTTLENKTSAEKSDLEQFATTTKETGIISALNESYGKASEQYNSAVRSEGSPVKDAYELRDKINNMQSAYGDFNKQKGELGGTIAVNYAMGAATGSVNGSGAVGSMTGEGMSGVENLTGGSTSTGMQIPEAVTGNGGEANDLINQLRQGKNPNLTGDGNKAQQISDLVQTVSSQQPAQSKQEKGFWRRMDDEFKAALDLGDKVLKDTPIIGEMHRNLMAEMKVTEGVEKANPLFANADTDQQRDGLAGRIASMQEGDISRAITGRAQKPNDKEVIESMRQGRNPLDASQNKEKPQTVTSPIDSKQMTALINMAKSDVVKS